MRIVDRDGGIIEWDEVKGTAYGSSLLVPEIQILLRPRDVRVPLWPFMFSLKNAKHRPADFLILLLHVGGGSPRDYGLPPALQAADTSQVPYVRIEGPVS